MRSPLPAAASTAAASLASSRPRWRWRWSARIWALRSAQWPRGCWRVSSSWRRAAGPSLRPDGRPRGLGRRPATPGRLVKEVVAGGLVHVADTGARLAGVFALDREGGLVAAAIGIVGAA